MVNRELEFCETKDMYLNALQSFNPNVHQKNATLDDYLNFVAKTGRTLFEWSTIRRYFLYKLETVMNDINDTVPFTDTETPPNMENCDSKIYIDRILKSVESFDGIPFTIQRLAELLCNPKKHYKRADKFFRALEKNVIIVTTVDPDGERKCGVSHVVCASENPYLMPMDNGEPFASSTDIGENPPLMDNGENPPLMDSGDHPPQVDSGEHPPQMDSGEHPPLMDSGEPHPPVMDIVENPPVMDSGEPYPPLMDSGEPHPPVMDSVQNPQLMDNGDNSQLTDTGYNADSEDNASMESPRENLPSTDNGENHIVLMDSGENPPATTISEECTLSTDSNGE